MKTITRILALSILFACAAAQAGPAFSEGEKNVLHFSLSGAAGYLASAQTSGTGTPAAEIIQATAFGMVPGLVKEISDHSQGAGAASVRSDLRTDLAGVLLGIYVERTLRDRKGWNLTGLSRSRGVTQLVISRSM